MREFYKNYLKSNLFFWLFSIIGVILIIVAFILPPLSVIDNSVLIAVGEINGFIALGAVIKAIDKGVDATFHHNNTELTITGNKDDKEEEDE